MGQKLTFDPSHLFISHKRVLQVNIIRLTQILSTYVACLIQIYFSSGASVLNRFKVEPPYFSTKLVPFF